MRTLRTLGLVAALALCGCYEEDVSVTLQPDGSGRLTLRYTAAGGLAALGGMFEFGDATPEQRANREAARQLATYTGVDAWTDVTVGKAEDGRTTVQATGWFADLAQVRKQGDGQGGERWTLSRDGDALVVTLADSVEPGGDGFSDMGPDPADVLDDPLSDLRGQQMALPLMMQGFLGGFEANMALTLPAAAEQAEGWTETAGNTVKLVRDSAWAGKVIRRNFERAIAVRTRMDAGELTREQAEAELAALQTGIDEHTVRCAASGAADPAFVAQLAAAREAWQASPWRRLVDEAVAKAAADAAAEEAEEDEEDPAWNQPQTPPPGGLSVTGEADRFEPNDHARRAMPTGPGGYENMQLDGHDWYRLDVPGAFELKATVLYDSSKGMLRLSIHDEQGNELSGENMYSEEHSEVARYAPGGFKTLLVHVNSFEEETMPYHLSLEFVPYEPADRFEPNDTEESAKPLEVGRHEELVCDGEDHYLLEVPAGHVLTATLAGADRLQLEVLERDPESIMSQTLASSSYARQGPATVMCRGTGQPLVLKVRTSYSQADGAGMPYALELSVSEEPKPDVFEPNNSRGKASRLEAGKHDGLWADPEDWYAVQLPEGKQLQLDVQSADAGEVEVEVFGWERREALVRKSAAAATLGWGPGAAGGTPLLIKVTAEALQGYALKVAFVDFVPADAHEPNDSRATAAAVGLGRHGDLVLTTDDYYAVELKAGQTLRVQLEFADGENGGGAFTAVKLLDPLGMELVDASWPDRMPLEHTVAAAGTYYLWIEPQLDEVGQGYTLVLE